MFIGYLDILFLVTIPDLSPFLYGWTVFLFLICMYYLYVLNKFIYLSVCTTMQSPNPWPAFHSFSDTFGQKEILNFYEGQFINFFLYYPYFLNLF